MRNGQNRDHTQLEQQANFHLPHRIPIFSNVFCSIGKIISLIEDKVCLLGTS